MQEGAAALTRMGIMEAAGCLGVSVDTVRRRIRKGEISAVRDNRGQWMLDLPDDAAPMQPTEVRTGPPAHAAMQDAYAGILRGQVKDLQARLDRAEERAERQGRELTAAVARASIAETEVGGVREMLAEARRPTWRRWLGWD